MFGFAHMEADCIMTDFIQRPFSLKKLKRAFSDWQEKLAGQGLERALSREPRPPARHQPLRQRALAHRVRQDARRLLHAPAGHALCLSGPGDRHDEPAPAPAGHVCGRHAQKQLPHRLEGPAPAGGADHGAEVLPRLRAHAHAVDGRAPGPASPRRAPGST